MIAQVDLSISALAQADLSISAQTHPWEPKQLPPAVLRKLRKRAASFPARWHPVEVRAIFAHYDAVLAEKEAR